MQASAHGNPQQEMLSSHDKTWHNTSNWFRTKSTCLNHNKTLLCILAHLNQLQWCGPSQSEIGSVGQSMVLITLRLWVQSLCGSCTKELNLMILVCPFRISCDSVNLIRQHGNIPLFVTGDGPNMPGNKVHRQIGGAHCSTLSFWYTYLNS